MGFNVEDDGVQGEESSRRSAGEGLRREETRESSDRGPMRGSLRTMGQTLGRALGRNSQSEALTKTVTALKNIFGQDATSPDGKLDLENFSVLSLDSSEWRTGISAAVLVLPMQGDGQTFVFYYTLGIEASAAVGGLKSVELGAGRRAEVPEVAGDALNDRLLEKVEQLVDAAVRKDYSGEIKLVDAGMNIMFAEVNPERDEDAVRSLAFYASAAMSTVAVEALKFQPPFDLGWLEEDDTLDVVPDFNPAQLLNANGQPRRTDVTLTVNATMREKDGNQRQQLVLQGGALEFVYSPPSGNGGLGGFGRRSREDSRYYFPQYTITTMDTLGRVITPELLVTNLAAAALLSTDLFWVNKFKPGQLLDSKRVNYHDTGVLTYLIDRKYTDLGGAGVSNEDFLNYLGDICREELVYAMDIEERGDNSWVLADYLLAAQGDREAEDRLFASFNTVTDGYFSSRFKELGGGHLVEWSGTRVLLGYYKDEHGELRDLRDFDLMKFLKLRGDNDPEMALDWQDIFDRSDLTPDEKVDRQYRMLQDVLGASAVKAKSYAQRVYIPSTVIKALAQAFRDCGVTLQRTSGANLGSTRVRGNTTVGRYAGSDLGEGLFTSYTNRRDDNTSRGRTYMGRHRSF